VALRLSGRAKARLDRFKPQLIHLATPDWLGLRARSYGRKRGLPVVTSFHSNIISYFKYLGLFAPPQRLAWAYFRNFYLGCDHIYVPAESMADGLRERGIDRNLRIWSRGVDPQRFSPDRRSMAWRRGHGIKDDEVVVVFVARLRWEKGLRLLTKVLQQLEREGVPHRSVVVGQGVGYEPMRKWLPNTVFTGHLEGDELATAYASSEVFLYPCETDTFGNVTLEAMACGLPTVCADAPGAKSIVLHEKTGLLAKSGDQASFVEATRSLVADRDRREAFAQRALARSAEFSWTATLDRLSGYYDELL
jgi:glycosyltransferase involved in cell wall biosynthesis